MKYYEKIIFFFFTGKKKKGFTLLELMVVVAIIGIFTTTTLVSMNENRRVKSTEAAGRDIASAIREAQHLAVTGKSLNATHFPCKYVFKRDGPDTIKIYYYYHLAGKDCSSVESSPDDYFTEVLNRTVIDTFKENNVNPCTTVGDEITFNVPYGITNICDGNSVGVEIKPVGASAATLKICVYPSGNILEIAGSDPCPAT